MLSTSQSGMTQSYTTDLTNQLLLDELLHTLLIQVSELTVPESFFVFSSSHIGIFLRLHGNLQIAETPMTKTNSNSFTTDVYTNGQRIQSC